MTAKFEKMFAIVTDDQSVKEGDEVLVTLSNGVNTRKVKLGPFIYENPFKLRFFAPASATAPTTPKADQL